MEIVVFYRRTFPTAFSVSEKREKNGSRNKTQDKWEVVRSLLTKPVTTCLCHSRRYVFSLFYLVTIYSVLYIKKKALLLAVK